MNLQTTDLLGIPKIKDLEDLSFHIKLSKTLLYKLARFPEKFYYTTTIPKKNGGVRNLACPSNKMKVVQAWILRYILEKIDINVVATAFRKKYSVRNNVDYHFSNRYFLCIDIKDFFDSVNYYSIVNIFESLGYNDVIARTLANICTYNGALPQGGVTSPALSNIICIRMDERLSRYAGARNIIYTRYADDMTFSAKEPERLSRARKTIVNIIKDEGFTINKKKTRYLGPSQRIKVTGLIVSKDNVGIGKQQKRILRAAIYNYENKQMTILEKEELYSWIHGWMSYLNSVDKVGMEQLKNYWKSLVNRNVP